MLKRNSLFVLVLVFAVSLTGCFGFLSGSKVEELELNAAKDKIGLADEDKTIELTVVGKDKKDKTIVVKLDDVKWTAVGGEVKVTGGKAIFTITATEAGNATVKATFDKVDSNLVTIKLNEGETPVDYTDLDAAITAAEALKADTGQGTGEGEASEEAHTTFATAIAAAKAVKADAQAKQPAVDAAVTTLNEAKVAFEAAIVTVDPNLVVEELFTTGDKNTFFSADYKALSSDASKAMNVIGSSGSNITLAEGALTFHGSRWTIGMPEGHPDTGWKTGEKDDNGKDIFEVSPTLNGDLDLSKPFKVIVEFSNPNGPDGKRFQIYLDNNTTNADASQHGGSSRILNQSVLNLSDLLDGERGVVETDTVSIGTNNSFLNIRTESECNVTIHSIKVEYVD